MAQGPIRLDVTLREDNLPQDSLEVIRKVRPNWDVEKVRHKFFTDGISNKLLGFFLDGKFEDDVVMIRFYGQNTEKFIDRARENKTMEVLNNRKCGSELYATFNQGICYEFVHGATLSMTDVRSPEVYPLVAAEMAKIHCTIPMHEVFGEQMSHESGMWEKFATFNDLVEEIIHNNPELTQKLRGFGFDVAPGFGTRAIQEMEGILKSKKMPVTFCHNDILLGNVIYNKTTSKITFIDFEYAMPNYPAFDVANHFNEFAGIENPDFSKCPDQNFKSQWIDEYLKHFKIKGVNFSPAEFKRWVELCQTASHLFWSLWAIVQAENSTIDFDFAKYFALRYTEYEKQIKEVRKSEF